VFRIIDIPQAQAGDPVNSCSKPEDLSPAQSLFQGRNKVLP